MKLSFPKIVIVTLFTVALTSIPAFASECVQPEACSSLAAKAAANFGATDPADYIKTWTFVNCDAQGYFRGAMLNYQNCQVTKAAEDKKVQQEAEKKAKDEKAKADAEKKKNEDAKKAGKPYTTRKEFGKDVKAGDYLRAGKGETVVIHYADGSEVVMAPGSSMRVKSDKLIELIRGKFEFSIAKLIGSLHKKFELPYRGNNWIMTVKGTKFLVDGKATSFTLRVLEGTVDVSDPKGEKKVEVNAGFSVVARKNGKLPKLKAFDATKLDKWYETTVVSGK